VRAIPGALRPPAATAAPPPVGPRLPSLRRWATATRMPASFSQATRSSSRAAASASPAAWMSGSSAAPSWKSTAGSCCV